MPVEEPELAVEVTDCAEAMAAKAAMTPMNFIMYRSVKELERETVN